MKNGAATGSISQIETLLRLSPAADSSQPTYSKKYNLLRSQKNICISNRKREKGSAQDATKLTRKPTCKLRHCEFFHLTGSRSLMPVIVPMYLQNNNI
jgi:hypothetical protein